MAEPARVSLRSDLDAASRSFSPSLSAHGAAAAAPAASAGGDSGAQPEMLEDDVDMDALPPLATLPIANVARLMKLALPSSSKIASGARDVVHECVCEFIAFLTSEAADRCAEEKRKTINGDDVLYAMRALGFDEYEAVCSVWLARYRTALEAAPRKRSRRGGAGAGSGQAGGSAGGGASGADDEGGDEEESDEDEHAGAAQGPPRKA